MRNMHQAEQIMRLATGGLFGGLYLLTGVSFLLAPFGLMVITAAVGFCPVYRLFKFDTL